MTTSHITCSGCGAALEVLSPEQVVAYLRRKGWTDDMEMLDAMVWRSGSHRIEQPQRADFRDHPQRFKEPLDDLRRIEGRPAAVIVEEMREGEMAAREEER